MNSSIKDLWEDVKDDWKEGWTSGRGWLKEHLVQPVIGMLGLEEGATKRKDMVEDFMSTYGQGDERDLNSLSAMIARTSRVDIVDISGGKGKKKGKKGKKAATRTEDNDRSWVKTIAGPLLARCGNKEAVEDEDTYGMTDSDSGDSDYDPPLGHAEAKGPVPRKMLHWKKIPKGRATGDTIWDGHTVATSDISEHSSELMQLFFVDPNQKKEKPKGGGDAASKSAKKPKEVSLLDLKRANNIAITLSNFKVPNEEIKKAILTLDTSILDLDQLQMLLALLPTSDEVKMLKAYKGEPEKLGFSERFLYTMAKIPKVEARLQGFIFKQEFNSRKEELKEKVTIVAGTAKRVIDSVKFKGVLEITLALGNFMNSGHQLGDAAGFSIESVLMLSGIKAGNKKISLMHYLAALVASKEPQLLDFAHDLKGCREAALIPVDALKTELRQLNKCCDELDETVKEIANPKKERKDNQEVSQSTATFLNIMSEFHKSAREELREVAAKMQLMEQRFQSLAKYFGEDPATFSASDFFTNVNAFVDQFEKSVKEMRQMQKEGMNLGAPSPAGKAGQALLTPSK